MSFLFADNEEISPYLKNRKNLYSEEGWKNIVDSTQTSTTIYLGNLDFKTTEEQLFALFSRIASVKRVIMGINRYSLEHCGFAFIDYYVYDDAKEAIKLLNEIKLDGRQIRVDMDPGFEEGRQFGRGRHGGQVREEHRRDYDSQRGGWGYAEKAAAKRARGPWFNAKRGGEGAGAKRGRAADVR